MECYTIEFDNMLLTVWGYYQPEEPMVWRYANGDGYPGSPEYFDVQEIYENGCDVTNDFSEGEYRQIEEIILKQR